MPDLSDIPPDPGSLFNAASLTAEWVTKMSDFAAHYEQSEGKSTMVDPPLLTVAGMCSVGVPADWTT